LHLLDPTAEPRKRRGTPLLACLGGQSAFTEPIFVTRSLSPDETAFQDRTRAIFASGWFTNNGVLVQDLEARLRAFLGVDLCALLCNGTVALQVALRGSDLSGKVITSPFTFPATVHAIEWNGLSPVFCDVDPETYNLDVAAVERALTDDTAAILPVHVFGNPCDVTGFSALARKHPPLAIIYDAAHAFGVVEAGCPIGAYGDLSIFSFHATKLFHTAEGGAITSASTRLGPRIEALRNFGILNEEEVSGVGLNGKLSEIHAAVGLGVLELVQQEIHHREALTQAYVSQLAALPGLTFQRFAASTQRNFAYMTLEIDPEEFGLTRDEVHRALRAENIVTRKYFFPLCSENPSYRDLESARPENLPHAHRLAQRILCLPLFGTMRASHVERIVDALYRLHAAAPKVRRALSD